MQRGLSLIELMIGLAIVGILLVAALPNFTVFLHNQRIRNAAEGALQGLNLARAEAVRRNVRVALVFTGTAPLPANVNTLVPINTGSNWVVRVYQPGGAYTAADFIQGGQLTVGTAGTNINVQRTDTAGNPYASGGSSADVDTLVFDGLARSRQVLNSATVVTDFAWIKADFINPTGGACQHAIPAGPMRCLRVVVNSGGQIKMCDQRVTDATDPRICPTP